MHETDSQEVLCVPTAHLHGYDFSYQGLLGIWEGFPPTPPSQRRQFVDDVPAVVQHSLLFEMPPIGPQLFPGHVHGHTHSASTGSMGLTPTGNATVGGGTTNHTKGRSRSPVDDLGGNWPAALAALAARRGSDRSSWKPTVHTSKLTQRQIGLQVIGWSLREDELAAAIKRWQKEGRFARAACWLVFTKQYSKAVELLMRSDGEFCYILVFDLFCVHFCPPR